MISVIDKSNCTGCGACSNICPQNCIQLRIDNEGFKYPIINQKMCINCNLCEKVCHEVSNSNIFNNFLMTYAYSNTDEIRMNSTSGGFFTKISDFIIQNNGVIYGAAYDETFNVIHTRATTVKIRNKQRGSKYVQSNMDNIFISIENDLKNNKIVLFTGNPCQVSAVLSYLRLKRIDCKLLITCDFICHGITSPIIWKDYLSFIEKKYNDKILSINFRNKDKGWHTPQLEIVMKEHIQKLTEKKDPYYNLFYSNCILRPSCHKCNYSKKERVSDFTMADCWGIEKSPPEFDDNMGLSFIMINTPKAKKLFNIMKMDKDSIDIDINDINQPHLNHAARESKKRDKFWEEYKNKGSVYVIKKYGNYTISRKIIKKSKKIICKIIGR